jgi:hypothetical protein
MGNLGPESWFHPSCVSLALLQCPAIMLLSDQPINHREDVINVQVQDSVAVGLSRKVKPCKVLAPQRLLLMICALSTLGRFPYHASVAYITTHPDSDVKHLSTLCKEGRSILYLLV